MTIVFPDEKPPLDELAHYGVKGMRWGIHRKEQTPEKQLAKLRKKHDNVSDAKAERRGRATFEGERLVGHYLAKDYKKKVKKNPNYAVGKLPEMERIALERKAANKARRSVLLRGVAETGLVLAGGHFLLKNVKLSPQHQLGVQVSVVLLAGQVGKERVSQLHQINMAMKQRKYHRQVRTLEKAISTKDVRRKN